MAIILNLLKTKRKEAILLGAVIVGLVLARAVYRFMSFESTDDAYVSAHVHMISPRIAGTVTEVLVSENQRVKKGQVLVQLDPRDFEVELKIAQANFSKAHKDLGRLSAARAFLPDEKPLYDSYTANSVISEAQLENAQHQLEYTKITAPEDGIVGRKSIETGMRVQPGQALLAVVEGNVWVTANFKENQVVQIKPGQDVEIEVDAVSGRLFAGKVDSVAPASGATFSLLPPDNATGNFTKIVQRIPVKILFQAESLKGYEDRLAAGMSTNVNVKVH